jgi:hypothetical protein
MEDVGSMFVKTYKRAWSHNLQDHNISLCLGEGRDPQLPTLQYMASSQYTNDVLILGPVHVNGIYD